MVIHTSIIIYAGMLIEGGIIAYDTNLKTGGNGARYLGIGMKNQYREDKVTVVLRAVLVQTGEVLLNVTATKTILSTGGGMDAFRFIEMGTELVELESGYSENEAVGYAVRAAIEAGVLELIYQGHDRGYWIIEGGHRHPHQVDGKNDKHDLEVNENEETN